MVAKSKTKKSPSSKKASSKKSSVQASPKKKKAEVKLKAKSKSTPKVTKKAEAIKPKTAAEKKRAQAAAAMQAAIEETENTESKVSSTEEEEFDPAAFFAASGGGNFRAHVMRKERVDLSLAVRFRPVRGPLVHNADLINLSKGGLCLKTDGTLKAKTVVRVEIPLPHTSELFAIQAEVVWSEKVNGPEGSEGIHTGLRFLEMSQAKQAVINQFIQQRRDEVIMAKIGLDRLTNSVPVAGLD